MTDFNKNGNIITKSSKDSFSNLYSGKQYNVSNATIEYGYKTNIFKPYGFNDCIKLNSTTNLSYLNSTTKTFLAYSYFIPVNGFKANTNYILSMYMYNNSNADIRIVGESGTQFSESNAPTHDHYYLTFTEKEKVIWCWIKFKSTRSDGLMHLMTYPNPGNSTSFTTGYQLYTGINIYEGSEVIRPSQNGIISGLYDINNTANIYENRIEFDDFIEY